MKYSVRSISIVAASLALALGGGTLLTVPASAKTAAQDRPIGIASVPGAQVTHLNIAAANLRSCPGECGAVWSGGVNRDNTLITYCYVFVGGEFWDLVINTNNHAAAGWLPQSILAVDSFTSC